MDKLDKGTIFKIYYNIDGTVVQTIGKDFQGGNIEVGFINLKTGKREFINHRFYLKREIMEKIEEDMDKIENAQ